MAAKPVAVLKAKPVLSEKQCRRAAGSPEPAKPERTPTPRTSDFLVPRKN